MVKNTKSVDGIALRDFRKSMGWSQRELAASLTPPVTQGTISAYENGKLHTPRKFSVTELEELCKDIGTEKVLNKPRVRKNNKYVAGQVMPDGGVVDFLGKWIIYPDGTTLSIKEYEETKKHNTKFESDVIHLAGNQVIKGDKLLNTTECSVLVAMRERMIDMLKDDKKFDALNIKYLTESYSMFKSSCSNE